MKLTIPRRRLAFTAAAAMVALSPLTQARADYSNTVAGYNPLAYWRFNETAASPAPNKVANLGSVGSAGDGYVVLDATKGQPGKIGNSVRLINNGNTVGFCGSKIDMPFRAALNPKAPFSVEFWAKPNSLGSDGTGFSPLSSFNPNWVGGGNRSGWLFYLNNLGRFQFRLGLTSGYAVTVTSTSFTATAGNWYHVVATYDGTTAFLYVNGVLRASGAVASGWQPNTQMALRIGGTPLYGNAAEAAPNFISASGIAGNRGYDGWMDEVAIYPKLLTANDVAAHFDAATTNTAGYDTQILADSPLGYWNLDEVAPTTPDPSTFPIAANSGSAGTAMDGTNMWGSQAAQPGAAYTGFGSGNNAVLFNGESGYVALGDDPSMHFSGQITMMAWIKPQVQDFFRDVIAHGWDGGYAETFLRLSRGYTPDNDGYGNGNYYEVGVSDGQTYYDSLLFPIPPGDIGNWVFLAGTYDGANWNLYRNGQLVSTGTSTHGALDVTNRWSIGSRTSPSPTTGGGSATFASEGLFFGGYIDEPAIFGTALSASDITTIYNAAQGSPVITRGPTAPSGGVFKGSSISFDVWAEGPPTLSYLWYSNGVSMGITSTNVTVDNLLNGTQKFDVVVTNPYGSTTGSVSVTVVAAPPSITAQPKPAKRFVGGAAPTFSVTASGTTPLTYFWTRNGTTVQAGSSATYTESSVLGAPGTYNIVCNVSNETGTVVPSSTAAFTVAAVPSGYAGAVLVSAPTTFYRLDEASGSTAFDFIGGQDGTYHSVTLGQPGYSVIDSDTAIAVGAVNNYMGNAVGLASGHHNFSIELWANGPAGQGDESTLIANGNGSSGTTATEQFSIDVAGGVYRFFTRGGGNSLYEADATVGPNGTWQHIVAVYEDSTGTMHIYVNGQESGTGGTRPAGLRAANPLTTIGAKHLGNDPAFDGYFTGTIDEVAIYNNVALDSSTIATHFAAAYGPALAPVIDIPPKPVTNYAGLPVTLSVAAHGTVPMSYQWKKNGVDIDGATDSAYKISPLASTDEANYSVGVTNGINPGKVSASAHVTVLTAPTSAPVIPGMVLHLTFDNNLTDVTGRGNNGTGIHLTGSSSNTAAPTYVSDGALGQGLHFASDIDTTTGTGHTNNDYVTLGVKPDLQFGSNADFTVSLWIRSSPANYALGDLPFLTTTVGSTFGNGLVLAWTYGYGTTPYPGGWAMSIFDTSGVGVGGRGEIGSINDGFWHHLAYVFDRAAGHTVYLDGVAAAFHKQSGTKSYGNGSIDTGSAMTIGQDPSGAYGESGSGDIDDLVIWKKALTPLEAASVFVAASTNHLSVATTSYSVTTTVTGGTLKLSWPVGILQGADNAEGPYTEVSGARSPYTVPLTSAKKFYRASTR